jgi:hypothetical protein
VTAVLATLDVMTDDNGVTVASGMGQVGRLPVSFDATAGRRGEDNAPRVSIDASVADAVMHVAAVAVGSRIDIEGSVEDLERLGALFAAEGLPAAPLDLNGSVMLGGDTYELRNVVAKVAAAEARLDADIGRETIDMERLEIKVGPSDFVGSLRADLGEPLALVVKGESKLIDVTPPPTRDPQAAPASAQPAGEPTEPKSPWLFGEEELPFDRLGSASIDIELKIAELRRAELRAQDIVLALKGENAVFNLATTFVDPQGGSGEGTVELATADNSADLSIALDLKDLRLNLMSGEVDSPQQVPPIGVSVDIRSKGTSPRALAASSTGRVVFTQGAGRVDNNAVGLASSDILAQVFSALNPFAKDEEHSNWECTVLRLDLTDGVGVLTPMLAQAEKILIVGSGTVDLTTEKLDIEFNTKPRSGVGVTADMFVTPFVKVGGTLAEPGVSLNAGGTLLAGGMAILTGGASILVKGMADRATAEGDQCAGALAELDARLEPAREKTSGASQLGEGRR